MPASVIPISGRREGVYVILEAVLPGRLPQNIGVLLADPSTDRAWVRVRPDFTELAEPDDIEVLETLENDIKAQLQEHGAERFLQSLEDSLSNVLRISDRQKVSVDAFTRAIDNPEIQAGQARVGIKRLPNLHSAVGPEQLHIIVDIYDYSGTSLAQCEISAVTATVVWHCEVANSRKPLMQPFT